MYKSIKHQRKEIKVMKNLFEDAEVFYIYTKVGRFQGYCFYPIKLSNEEKKVLFGYSYFVGLDAFVQNPSEEMEEDIYKHLFNEDRLYLLSNKHTVWNGEEIGNIRIIAFLSTRDIMTPNGLMLYISGICVSSAYQGYGIGRCLMNEAYKKRDYNISALRTQNPVMKESFDKTIGGLSYPNGDAVPSKIRKIGKGLAEILDVKEYDEEKMVCRGAYGSCLYGIEPSSFHKYYENKFMEINKQAGDSIICVKEL